MGINKGNKARSADSDIRVRRHRTCLNIQKVPEFDMILLQNLNSPQPKLSNQNG